MRPAAFGIAYYCWVSRRKLLKLGIGIAVCLAALFPFFGSIGRFSIFIYVLSFLAVCCFVIFFPFEATPNRFGYPRELFRLPVPTRSLVFWPWLFCTLSSSLTWVAFTAAVSQAFGAHWPVLTPCLLFAAGVACVLAGMWAPLSDPLTKQLGLWAALAVSGGFALWLIDVEIRASYGAGQPEYATRTSPYTVAMTLFVWLAAAYPAAHAAVACDRHGDRWLPGFARGLKRICEYLKPGRLPQPFGSPARAQLWYGERSLQGVAAAAISLVQLGLFVLLLGASRIAPAKLPPHVVVFVTAVGLPITFVGLGVLISVFLPVLGIQLPHAIASQFGFGITGFTFVRPIRSGGIAVAILRSALVGALSGCLFCISLVIVAAVGWHYATGRTVRDWTRDFGELWTVVFGDLPAWQCFGVMALSASAGVAVLWKLGTEVMLAPRGRKRLWAKTATLCGLVAVNVSAAVGVSLLLDPATRAQAVRVFTWLGMAFLAGKVLVAVTAFRAARRAGLFEGRELRDFRACWLAVAGAVLVSAAVLLPAELPMPTWLVLLWVLVLMPLGRLPLIAHNLEWVRHQ
jgi:hypothetical protein